MTHLGNADTDLEANVARPKQIYADVYASSVSELRECENDNTTVVLTPGTYDISGASALTLGSESKLIGYDGATIVGDTRPIIEPGHETWIENVTVDANGSDAWCFDVNGDDVVIKDNMIQGASSQGGRGVRFSENTRVTVWNNEIDNCDIHIHGHEAPGLVVAYNYCTNTSLGGSHRGIWLTHFSQASPQTQPIVHGNRVENVAKDVTDAGLRGTSGTWGNGLQIARLSGASVTANTVGENCLWSGLVVSEYTKNCTFANNVVYHGNQSTVAAWNEENGNVGNRYLGNTFYGRMYLASAGGGYGAVYLGNRYDGEGQEVDKPVTNDAGEDMVFSHNTIENWDCDYSISDYDSTGCIYVGNQIRGIDGTNRAGNGIHLRGTGGSVNTVGVAMNNLMGLPGDPMHATDPVSTDAVIEGNLGVEDGIMTRHREDYLYNSIGGTDTSGTVAVIDVDPSPSTTWSMRVRAYSAAASRHSGAEFVAHHPRTDDEIDIVEVNGWEDSTSWIVRPSLTYDTPNHEMIVEQQAAGGNAGNQHWHISYHFVGEHQIDETGVPTMFTP